MIQNTIVPEEPPLEGETAKPAKKKSTSKKPTSADVMKRLELLERNLSESAALIAESDGKVEDIYFMTSDIAERIKIVAEASKAAGDVPEGSEFVTSREQFNTYGKLLNRREGELANQKLMNLMTQMCAMKEDFEKLCAEMKKKIKSFTAADVLESFRAYSVDMENMLTDAGVTIGAFGADGEKVNTLHQRIMGVVPTDDPAKNGTVAKRLSAGYEYNGRVLVKEKVNVFKKTGGVPEETQTEETE